MALSEQVRTVSVSPAMVQQRAADLVKSDAQILLLRARPEWSHGDVKVGDDVVRVLPGVSQLAVLDILASLASDEQAVVLTDRPAGGPWRRRAFARLQVRDRTARRMAGRASAVLWGDRGRPRSPTSGLGCHSITGSPATGWMAAIG